MMKRNREGDDDNNIDITAMSNCLVLLSSRRDSSNRVFTCKTCDKQFTSFQALGGHRASHKKPRMATGEDVQLPLSLLKPKSHECSICGLEFPIGQALGGHMRKHRSTPANIIGDDYHHIKQTKNLFLSLSQPQVRRVLCLDLNLTPLENKFMFGLSSF